MNKKIRETPELNVPKGYEFGEIYETDDTGYGFDKPIVEQEVDKKKIGYRLKGR